MRSALILSMGLGLLAGCGPKEPVPVTVAVGFLPALTLRPSARVLPLGDTLWLEATYSDSLLDYHSGRRYRVRPQDLAFTSALFYRELHGVGQERTGLATTFRVVEKLGRASIDGAYTGTLEPVYDGQYYRATIGLIPTKACVTSISLLLTPARGAAVGDFLPFIHLPRDAQGRAQRAQLDQSFYSLNDGQANNFDLFRQYYNTFSQEPGAPLPTILYEQQSTFTVEVK